MAHEGQFILGLTADAVAGGDVLGGEPHVIAVENFPEAVMDHEVDDGTRGHAHPVSPAGVGQGVGDIAHVFHAAGHHDVGIAGLDDLGRQDNGLHAGGADLIDGDRVCFLRQTGVDAGLAAWILSQGGREAVTHDAFVEIDGVQR
ncbi:MAG: hypothetical protein A4E72_00705 [Syntrophus sp. PtaU1.Bin208]|nr:MAG: hypothetical protein A4E72_00705 [Syntrophus sp. PtaU1.Bin208]